jgi:uncharacterized membrane protein YvbJ
MKCTNCGTELAAAAAVCESCGTAATGMAHAAQLPNTGQAASPVKAKSNKGRSLALGALLIAAGVVVFIICNIIQGMGNSSMFSMTYVEPDNAVLDLLLNVTFYPGWIATIGLIIYGGRTIIRGLFAK